MDTIFIKKRAAALFMIGLLFILGSVIVFFAPSTHTKKIEQRTSSSLNHFRLESNSKMFSLGPNIMLRKAELNISYPSKMRENETLLVEVTYSAAKQIIGPSAITPDKKIAPHPWTHSMQTHELLRDVSIELSSSGFAIEPKGTINIENHTRLPFRQSWTITPSAEGLRYILLTVHEEKKSMEKITYSAQINSEPTTSDASGMFKLPVTVTTYWGVSHVTSSVIGFILGGFGALLSYPIVVIFLKRLFHLREKD